MAWPGRYHCSCLTKDREVTPGQRLSLHFHASLPAFLLCYSFRGLWWPEGHIPFAAPQCDQHIGVLSVLLLYYISLCQFVGLRGTIDFLPLISKRKSLKLTHWLLLSGSTRTQLTDEVKFSLAILSSSKESWSVSFAVLFEIVVFVSCYLVNYILPFKLLIYLIVLF